MPNVSTLFNDAELELARRRWPEGPSCPYCSGKHLYGITGRRRFKCANCRRQFGILTMTVLHSCKMSAETILKMRAELAKGSHAYGLEKTVGISGKTAMSHVSTRDETLELLGWDIPAGETSYDKGKPDPWSPMPHNPRRHQPVESTRRLGRHQKTLLSTAARALLSEDPWIKVPGDRKVVQSMDLRGLMEARLKWTRITPKGILALSRFDPDTARKAIVALKRERARKGEDRLGKVVQ